jgi:aminoglycoside phosphotransferase family enzyme/predicted kinase
VTDEPLDLELVRGLRAPAAYPAGFGAERGVSEIQTHLSHVFLVGERVYKLHKAARFGFVDFSTREARNADSLREVRLNRRLAPDVYLGVAAVEREGSAVRVGKEREELAPPGPDGLAPEHCVVMRRLPEGRDALSLLERGELSASHVDSIAELIAGFHASHGLGAPAPFGSSEWLERIAAPVRESFSEIADVPELAARARAALARAERFLADHAERFDARRRSGRVVDGHGDLHLQHLWFERASDSPIVIDCLEFRDDYRQIDTASEVAFLAMDLSYRRRSDLAERFLRRYARARDDFDLYGVVDFFAGYRAAVRAKVASLASRDRELPESQRAAAAASADRHLTLAESALAEPARGDVLAVAGVVGTGKSSVAEALADAVCGVVISSDRVRKAQAHLPATARGHGELYSDERTTATYSGMLERAAPVVDSGRVAILDATHARRALRDPVRRWAAERGVRAWLVEVTCAAPVTLARLAARRDAGADPSDAGPELHAQSVSTFEPPDEWPAEARTAFATDSESWPQRVAALARGLRLRGSRPTETGGSP